MRASLDGELPATVTLAAGDALAVVSTSDFLALLHDAPSVDVLAPGDAGALAAVAPEPRVPTWCGLAVVVSAVAPGDAEPLRHRPLVRAGEAVDCGPFSVVTWWGDATATVADGARASACASAWAATRGECVTGFDEVSVQGRVGVQRFHACWGPCVTTDVILARIPRAGAHVAADAATVAVAR